MVALNFFTVLFFLLFLNVSFAIGEDSRVELEEASQPTSQPTFNFVAPSVPDDIHGGEPAIIIPNPNPTFIPTASPTVKEADMNQFNEELEEESMTAINSSAYMFVTLVILIAGIGGAYYIRR
jgi:hypothetical protein